MEEHLIHYQLVDMIYHLMKKVHKLISVHQLLEAPRQLPLPSVRELESNVVAQQERNEGNDELVQPSLSQSSQHVDNIENSQERRLALNPQHQ